MEKIKEMRIRKGMKVSDLLDEYGRIGGFTAEQLHEGGRILEKMLKDRDSTNFLSFPACIVATGMRGLIAQMVPYFDCIVTTCGTLDHDLARAFGGSYYKGDFDLDDVELDKKGIHRLGNLLIPKKNYGKILEDNLQPILKELEKEKSNWASWELINAMGKRIKDKNSIVFQAAKNSIPIIVPGFFDGAVGTNVYIHAQGRKFSIDLMKDEKIMENLVFDSKRRGALMLGGGISKHHTIWWSQFKGGLDYAVYITTAMEQDGSLSGARTKEAISWGKIKRKAKHVTVWGEATVLLPLLWAASLEKL